MRFLNWIAAGVVVLLAVFVSSMSPAAMRAMQIGFLAIATPFFQASTAVGQTVENLMGEKKSPEELRKENYEIISRNRLLEAENKLLREMEQENQKLRQALDYKEKSLFKLVPARVVARDASTWWNTVKINRGFADGLDSDAPVLTENGLVGKTTTVAKNISTVLLISDETCKVAARVEGTQEKGILSGMRVQDAAADKLQLNFLTKNAALEPGTKVYTAGVSKGVFPSGILIGTVETFKVRELDGQAIVKPAVDLSALEDVFIVVGAK